MHACLNLMINYGDSLFKIQEKRGHTNSNMKWMNASYIILFLAIHFCWYKSWNQGKKKKHFLKRSQKLIDWLVGKLKAKQSLKV